MDSFRRSLRESIIRREGKEAWDAWERRERTYEYLRARIRNASSAGVARAAFEALRTWPEIASHRAGDVDYDSTLYHILIPDLMRRGCSQEGSACETWPTANEDHAQRRGAIEQMDTRDFIEFLEDCLATMHMDRRTLTLKDTQGIMLLRLCLPEMKVRLEMELAGRGLRPFEVTLSGHKDFSKWVRYIWETDRLPAVRRAGYDPAKHGNYSTKPLPLDPRVEAILAKGPADVRPQQEAGS
jgi:hypothetical protein